MVVEDREKRLRKRLLSWHYNKSRTINIIDLLESSFQCFRRGVAFDLNIDSSEVDFRDAIKRASLERLEQLDMIILEERIDNSNRKRRRR